MRICAVALLIVTLVGCSGTSTPWSPVKVSGKITYDDGSIIPAKSIKLEFRPQAPPINSKEVPRVGVANVNVADGTFDAATTYKAYDGVIPGKCRVVVQATDGPREVSKKVPKEYTAEATTPIEVDTANTPFEIKIKKP